MLKAEEAVAKDFPNTKFDPFCLKMNAESFFPPTGSWLLDPFRSGAILLLVCILVLLHDEEEEGGGVIKTCHYFESDWKLSSVFRPLLSGS